MLWDVYLSYCSRDRLIARLMRGYFRCHNINTWFDEDNTELADSATEEAVRERLAPVIDTSQFMVVLVSKNTAQARWVQYEVEHARSRSIKCIGIIIDDVDAGDMPSFMGGIHCIRISGELGQFDQLKKLREQIGRSKPTYIDSLKPSVMKQIPAGRLDEHLAMCRLETVDLWFINGGYTIPFNVLPALTERFRTTPERPCHCRVLLMTPPADDHAEASESLASLLRQSGFVTRPGSQAEMAEETFGALLRFADDHPNFSLERRVTSRLPPGRHIFVDDYFGFFGPYMPYTMATPFLVFDRNSPYYPVARTTFEGAFQAGVPYPPYPLN